MGLSVTVLLISAGALLAVPPVASAGGRIMTGRGGGVRGPSAPPITAPPGFGGRHRFTRHPFVGGFTRHPFVGGVVTNDDVVEVVREVPVAVPVVVRESPPPVPPIGDPKFVFPPQASPSGEASSHTVVIQRGSNVEVQSFPPTPAKQP